MIKEKIEKIEKIISDNKNINLNQKNDLLNLIKDLKIELTDLKDQNNEDFESIAQFAETSALEATKTNKKNALMDLSLKGLNSSVEGFETTHPQLTKTVNSLAEMLSNIGI